ncbi:replication initiation protein [Zooshikella harenae]|uniref:Replication initiation protein n=1 Tax=Zooshikella harenae TaxID=2827238 RepID=A0ABS5ZJ49_9GAMM|nr:replication initiation protein [Zooshikella harenae]MBU2714101.1 replication initiation protein [Zooshikella harenae]
MGSDNTEIDKLRITKANQLVEAVLIETTSKLTLRDQKVILAVISQLSPDDEDFKKYHITLSELEKLTNIDKQNLYRKNKQSQLSNKPREIEEICKRLMSSLIQIREPEEPDGFLMANWFSHARYSPSRGLVEFSFSPELKPYLLQVKNSFTTYHLKQVINLQSVYSIRLYELLRQFLTLKAVKEGQSLAYRKIELSQLRGFIGVEEGRYKRFAEFRRNVLDKTQRELSEKTDIAFDYEPIRKGRSVNSINFTIRHNVKFEAIEDSKVHEADILPDSYDEAVAAMLASAVPELPDQVVKLLASKLDGISASQAFLSYTKAKQAGKVKDSAAYFLGILRHQEQQSKSTREPDLDDMSWVGRGFDEY